MPIHNPPHILIIDADASAAQVTRSLVLRVNPSATWSIEPTAERGSRSADAHPPDVLIIDPNPIDMEATRLMQHVRSDCPDARIIVLSSSTTPTLRRYMYEIGADLFFEKPSAPAGLFAGLRMALQS